MKCSSGGKTFHSKGSGQAEASSQVCLVCNGIICLMLVLNFDHKFALTNIYHSYAVCFLDLPSPGLETMKLPCKMRKRGRPKGANKTVIGLPRKKSRGNKPVSFLYKGVKQLLFIYYLLCKIHKS